jgi:hypothetical protein
MKSETLEGKSLSLYNLQFKSKMVKVLVGKINNYLRCFVSLGLYSKKLHPYEYKLETVTKRI